ncbi:hypothetical protein DM480_17295 (plasmid) [Sphingomonas sp. FARSPH]|jgi:Bacterial mobilisation protein (MobC)|nr:hypothetical protein DM480_17295 [Sphingomonas sp. FARSPH]
MPAKLGQKLIATYVDAEFAERFAAWARQTEGGSAAALRRLMAPALDGQAPVPPAGAGMGQQIGVRFKPLERRALAEAARARSTSPANWLRSLALFHLARKPQWNAAELDALRDIFGELRRIGGNVNQIARAMNVATETGAYPPYQGGLVREAALLARLEMRRVVAVMTGNFAYWGSPYDDVPEADGDTVERVDAAARAAERRRKRQPRRRPARFRDGS